MDFGDREIDPFSVFQFSPLLPGTISEPGDGFHGQLSASQLSAPKSMKTSALQKDFLVLYIDCSIFKKILRTRE